MKNINNNINSIHSIYHYKLDKGLNVSIILIDCILLSDLYTSINIVKLQLNPHLKSTIWDNTIKKLK